MADGRILHYEIVRPLGHGGMGEVFEALDTRLGRRVAIKFISERISGNTDSVRRFEREARAAAQLSHPHIATVHALEHDGERLFIVAELLTGGTLRSRMPAGGMDVPMALALTRDMASALAHAHARGIVHRDVKPENMLFAGDGALKLTDFGLAKLATSSQLTMVDTTVGTVSYLAPESIGGAGDARADVFALGVVLFELLTGQLPFRAENPMAMMYQIANAEPVSPSTLRAGLAPEVCALALALLAKTPATRPDATEAARRLAELCGTPPDGSPGSAPDALLRTQEMPVPGDTIAIPSPPRHRRSSTPALAIAGGVAAAALAFVLWRAMHPAPDASGGGVPESRRIEARALADDAARFLTLGELDSAQARAEAALRLDPRSASGRINLAQVLRGRGEATRAAALLSAVTRDAQASAGLRASAWEALGDMALADRTWPEAVRDLEQSFAIDSSERGYSQLGYALVRAARPADALVLLRRGLARYPGSAPLHKNAAYALLRSDSLAAARAEVERAVALDPAFTPAYGVRARIAARTGDAPRAQRDLAAFLAGHPDPADSAEVAGDVAGAASRR